MSVNHPLERAVQLLGLQRLASELKVTYNALRKWQAVGRMPRTEWTGETRYSETIEHLTAGAVTKGELLAPWPAWEPKRRRPRSEVPIAVVAGCH